MKAGTDMFRSSENCPQHDMDPLVAPEANGMMPEDVMFRQSIQQRKTHWSISWSDLMMTMFIFFMVLYVYNLENRKAVFEETKEKISYMKENIAGKPDEIQAPFSAKFMKETLSDLNRQEILITRQTEDITSVDLVNEKAVRIILPGDLLFDAGRVVLKAEAKQSLGEIAEIIKKTSCVVNVVGHTDDIPLSSAKYPTNWELSVIRASVVVRFLIEDLGLSAERFFISGHSYHMPIKLNNSAKNRAANRRVEIILTKEKPYDVLRSLEIF